MGIDLDNVPESFRSKVEGQAPRRPKPDAHLKYEREHTRRVVRLCHQNGLCVGWSATNRRSTYTEGWPDLSIPYGDKVLFIELKAERGKISAAQWDLFKAFHEQGTEVKIAFSDQEAWEMICTWLWNNFKFKPVHID